ncbi:hypothetical protein QEN19_002253 [Hanseniaspora menglaensis]
MSYNIWDEDGENTKSKSLNTNFLAEDNPFNTDSAPGFDIWNDGEAPRRELSDYLEDELVDNDINKDQFDLNDDVISTNTTKPELEIKNIGVDHSYDSKSFEESSSNLYGKINEDRDNDSIKDLNNDILHSIIDNEEAGDDIFDSLNNAKPNIAELNIDDIDIEKNIFIDDDIEIDIFGNDENQDNVSKNNFSSKKSGSVNKADKKTHGRNVKKLFVMSKTTKNINEPLSTKSSLTETVKNDSKKVDDILSSYKKSENIATLLNEKTAKEVSVVFNTHENNSITKVNDTNQEKLSSSLSQQETKESLSLSLNPVHSIEISDPYKVGDITNSFIEYKITTILSPQTIFKERSLANDNDYERTFIVKRRYTDFRWLYRHLQQAHWGVIIPSPPDKSLKNIIRVSDNDSITKERKELLVSMLSKMSCVQELQFDQDFLEFLTNIEVSKFSQYYKIRDQETLSYALNDPLDLSEISRMSELKLFGIEDGLNVYGESKGMETEQYLKKKILQATRRSSPGGSSLTKAIFGFASNVINDEEESANSDIPKYCEPDSFFDDAEDCWDSLFSELKNLDVALKNLKESKEKSIKDLERLAEIFDKLSYSNITEKLNKLYNFFSTTHIEVANVVKRSSDLEKLILSDYVQDQLRSLNNSTSIFNQRYKIGCILVLLEWIVINKKFGKEILEGENLTMWEKRYTAVKLRWRQVGATIKKQLFKFDITRVIEFRNCIEIYVETCKEQQKELIEIWETFYNEAF